MSELTLRERLSEWFWGGLANFMPRPLVEACYFRVIEESGDKYEGGYASDLNVLDVWEIWRDGD